MLLVLLLALATYVCMFLSLCIYSIAFCPLSQALFTSFFEKNFPYPLQYMGVYKYVKVSALSKKIIKKGIYTYNCM